jgi:hypothetical protein
MPSPRRLPLRIIVVLCLIADVCVLFICFLSQEKTPKHLTELAERIKAEHVEWQIVPIAISTNDYNKGFYVCTSSYIWEDLQRLHSRAPAHYWQGTVRVLPAGPQTELAISKGKRDLPLGSVVLFGDIEVAQQIVCLMD